MIENWNKYGSGYSKTSEDINMRWTLWKESNDNKALNNFSSVIESFANCIDDEIDIKCYFNNVDPQNHWLVQTFEVNISKKSVEIGISRSFFIADIGKVIAIRSIGALMLIFIAVSQHNRSLSEFSLCVGDDASGSDVGPCAKFADTLLIPDPYFMGSAGYSLFRNQIDHEWRPWISRDFKIFWRGSTTGQYKSEYTSSDIFKSLQRTEMCYRLKNGRHRDICDVGISSIVQVSSEQFANNVRLNLLAPRVERKDQLRYKFIIDIDGNTNSWGFFESLIMGHCVLKVGSVDGFRQWYYDDLTPGEHFLSVASDLADIDNVIDWIVHNESRCQQIACNAKNYARNITFDSEIKRAVDGIVNRYFR